MTKQRDYAIDFLKFFAALLITNSHLDGFEPAYPLSTGGSFGDALFFFCSGYTLFLGSMGRFDNWYGRRLRRIFPPVICWGIVAALCFGSQDTVGQVVTKGGGWFVQCILIYYLLAYPIRRFLARRLWLVGAATAVVTCVWFALTPKAGGFVLYGWNYCKWAAFFLFFLQGAALGLRATQAPTGWRPRFWPSLGGLLASAALWYGLLYAQTRLHWPLAVQLLTLVPLLGFSFCFFRWCKSRPMEACFRHRLLHPAIRTVGGLCFEVYIVQITLLNSVSLPLAYPLNVAAMWGLIFLWAYVLHVCTNFFVQTLRSEGYDWKKILSVY